MKHDFQGRFFLNTRPVDQAESLTVLSEGCGAKVLEFPCIELSPCVNQAELTKALEWLGPEGWIFFTSANGVRAVCEHVALEGRRIAVIGEATAGALKEFDLSPQFVAEVSVSEDFADEFIASQAEAAPSAKALLLRARIASQALPERLSTAGFAVRSLPVYESRMPEHSKEDLRALDEALPRLSMLFFTSSQAVRNFSELLAANPERSEIAQRIPVAVIGPKTAATVEQFEFSQVTAAKNTTVESLLEAAAKFLPSQTDKRP